MSKKVVNPKEKIILPERLQKEMLKFFRKKAIERINGSKKDGNKHT